ncbi:hypothetical protein HN51_062081 [Arachis hypogaea]
MTTTMMTMQEELHREGPIVPAIRCTESCASQQCRINGEGGRTRRGGCTQWKGKEGATRTMRMADGRHDGDTMDGRRQTSNVQRMGGRAREKEQKCVP